MKKDKNRILVVDIETTGFSPSGACIVEVGIVALDLESGDTEILLDTLVDEEAFDEEHHSAWIFENSDLTVGEVEEKGRHGGEVYKEVQEILDAFPLGVTAFNKSFDFRFLRDRGVNILRELECPMLLATDICKLPNLSQYGGYKWPKVEEAWAFFRPGEKYKEAHRGADDAVHEAGIIHAMYLRGDFDVI
ncbi:hypothetical protein DRO27_05460 [Candidatus Bathyarchaeota archaeon]|nr:MAG: hypothetical protein DRO27_05460 [Candidatus Bathyarchaeota archaeon]